MSYNHGLPIIEGDPSTNPLIQEALSLAHSNGVLLLIPSPSGRGFFLFDRLRRLRAIIRFNTDSDNQDLAKWSEEFDRELTPKSDQPNQPTTLDL